MTDPVAATHAANAAAPLVLVRRLVGAGPEGLAGVSGAQAELQLPLSAERRARLRGRRRSACGRELILQLPRGDPLQPGELLAAEGAGPWVRVEAAPEALLLVRSADPLALLQAAYHLGNRHVALEIRSGALCLLEDPVLAALLEQRGLQLERCRAPFLPEAGAYGGSHSHVHRHDHAHG